MIHRLAVAVALAATAVCGCSLVIGIEDECAQDGDCPQIGATCVSGVCVAERNVRRIRDAIRASERWTAERDYLLEDTVFVERGTLTIEAGTRIYGAQPQAALVVLPAATLVVDGTRQAPVVFSSIKPPGQRAAGDWGGVALLGNDFINASDGTDFLEGLESEPRTRYGGSGDGTTQGCGRLTYLRIEFAGFRLFANQELNGLTLAGCGPETLVDYVQVHRGDDDGIELFGGRAKIFHAVITQPADDGLDWDQGWRGFAQFVIVQQRASDKNGIEADNDEFEFDLLPRSAPRVYNVTVVAENNPQTRSVGATLRRGTAGQIVNAVFAGHRGGSLVVENRPTQSCAFAADPDLNGEGCSQDGGTESVLDVRGVLYADGGEDGSSHFGDEFDDDPQEPDPDVLPGFVLEDWARDEDRNAAFYPRGVQVLVDPLDETAPNFAPVAGGPVDQEAALAETPPMDEEFDSTASFLGAIRSEADDWTQGWTHYPLD